MKLRRHPHVIVILAFALATLASLGPHLLMLGYSVAGATPPPALLFICPLHGSHVSHARSFALSAKPLT